MKNTIKKLIKNNSLLLNLYDRTRTYYEKMFVSDEKKLRKLFKKRLNRELNLKNPVKYNDKIQWLKLYWRDPLATKCADKYKVREFISETIGDEYLNELIAVYDSVDEIDIQALPQSFVLKGTHGSGYNIICKDKDKMNWKKEFKKMRRWLRLSYYLEEREWVYKDIKPRIICEKYMEEANAEDLRDYKIFCFNGEPKLIQVDANRFNDHKRNYYDLDWNLLDISIDVPSDTETIIHPPEKLSEMIELSKVLSKNFPHVRVDFYEVDQKIIFGELTFFHSSGFGQFNPPEYETEWGNYLELPKVN